MLQGLYTGLSGLISYRKALDVTSHNIANANNLNYSKQIVHFSPNPIKDDFNIRMGTGVNVSSVKRSHDSFLFNNIKYNLSENSKNSEMYEKLSTLNNIMKENIFDDNSILDLTEQYFLSVQDIADNPDNIAIKNNNQEIFNNLENKFNKLNNDLDQYKNNLVDEYTLLEDEANNYLIQLEDISKKIQNIEALNYTSENQTYANQLRDERNNLEQKLSTIGNFKSYINPVSEDENIDYDTNYNFEFSVNGGKLEGISNSLKSINNLQEDFINTYSPIQDKINSFIDNNMENPTELLEWYSNSSFTKDFEKVSLGFSTNVDNIKSNLNSTEIILEQLNNIKSNRDNVNIDEEMTNMINYQRAYEANAKVIQTMDEILKTTINLKQ